ncbi:hypothetical protein LguiA_020092 [Lonicera macranthoides]
MLHRSFKPAKCKTSCKLATSRLKLMKNKKGVQLNQMKKELAQLLQSGQDQTARIRVEHVVREEKTIAAYDLIEIYCELIVARMPIIESQKNCPIDLKEAVASVIFASPRCADIPELLDIRKHLTVKYGKEFTSAAIELRPDSGVSRMLVEKLSVVAPDGPTKIKILKAIAEEHNIQWEPKAFGEKDAKPPDDLLNGPTTFEKASTMHVEPPKFQAPLSQDQKHEEPLKNYEQNIRSSMNSQNFASTDTGGIEASSATSHPDVRPDVRPSVRNSGIGSERMEVRHSFHGDSDAFSAGRQNWNMGFKDAMSAAQAAAESAELASMAARAAAELSRQFSSESQKTSTHDLRDERHQTYPSSNMTGERQAKSTTNHPNITQQHSTVSQKSNIHGLRDESLEKLAASNLSFEENQAKDTVNHSSHDRNPNITRQYSAESRKSNIDALRVERSPQSQNERIEKKETPSYSDSHHSAKRSSQSPSSRSSKASIDDDMLINSISKGEEYSRKSSFEEEATKVEKGTIYSEMSMKKQSRESEVETLSGRQDSFESRNLNPFGGERIEKQFSSISPRSRSSTFGDDYAVSDSKNDANEGPFVVIDKGSIRRDTGKSKSYDDDDTVAFDEYSSDESGTIDIGPAYDEVESKSYFSPLDRTPSLEKSTDKGPTFDEVEPKSYFPLANRKPSLEKSTLDDFGDVTFDYSDGPKFDSEDEFEKSRRNGRKGSRILAEERNSGYERKSKLELNDINGELSVFNPINSFLHEVEENVESSDTLKENEFHHSSSGSESGKELKFGMLTGGLRNKGYNKRPPYFTPSTDASSSFKKSAEGPAPIDRTAPTSVRSSFNSRVSRNADEKLRSTVSTVVSDSDSDSDSDGLRANKEVNTRPILKSRITSFDRDSADSIEDLRKQNQANRVRLGSGLSRRTKATPSSSSSRVRLGSEAVGVEARSSGQLGGREEPSSEKQLNSKPLPDSISPPREGSSNTPEPLSQPNLEKRADPNPITEAKTQPREGSLKTSEPWSQPHKSSQWGNREQPGLEKQAVSKPVTAPKIQPHEGSFKAPELQTQAQSLGQYRNQDRTKSEKQASLKPTSEPKTESHFEPPLRAQLAANRTEKQAASKPTYASIPSREGRSEGSTSTVASNVDESVKKSSSLSREDSTGDNSRKNASHVHPKLPDYDDVFAHFQALRANRQ